MLNYPNGKNYIPNKNAKNIKLKNKKHILNASNRGMKFEKLINETNTFYLNKNIAVIYKRPTPIKIIKIDYTKNLITKAYFEKQSNTDYNGVYKGKYIDFEVKSVQLKTSFPLHNIPLHQIKHLEKVILHKGISFFLINFSSLNETYFLNAKYVINFYKNSKRRSIPINEIKKNGYLIKLQLKPKYDYLSIIDKLY